MATIYEINKNKSSNFQSQGPYKYGPYRYLSGRSHRVILPYSRGRENEKWPLMPTLLVVNFCHCIVKYCETRNAHFELLIIMHIILFYSNTIPLYK